MTTLLRREWARWAVTINVVNAEDDGVVTPTQREPQIGKEVVAGLTDEDGNVRGQSWQWFRNATATTDDDALGADNVPLCKAEDGTLSDQLCRINDATSPNYTPGDDDEGELLAARVTYTDAFVTPESPGATPIVDDGDSMSVVMQANVEMEDAANTAPKFSDDQDPNTPGKQADAEREVPENKKDANVGDPVTATDTGDLLIYSLSGADEASFTIVSGLKDAGKDAGQIRTAEKLDYETKDMYVVVVTATDPTGATDTINVMISVTDEDDKTEIAVVDVNGTSAELEYEEGRTDAVATFSASDEDDDAIDWTKAGEDAGDFEIDEDASGNGVLTFKKVPNYESPVDDNKNNVYLVTVKASEASELEIEVTVTDKDEDGEVGFEGRGQFQPQVGRSLLATLTDQDADVQDEKWQWSRGPSADGPWTAIDKATSASRSPVADDLDMYLQATVTYEDKFDAGKTASAATENSVEDRTTANAAPSFKDLDDRFDDPDTDGEDNSGTQVNRDVDEGVKGANVGKPITATDANNDALHYTIDAGSTADFSINSRSGQLKTKNDGLNSDDSGTTGAGDSDGELNRTVMVTATDPSGASATQAVTVTIVDVNDSPKFPTTVQKELWVTEKLLALRTGAASTATELGTGEYVATDADLGDGGAARDAVTDSDDNVTTAAVVPLTYSVEGADKDKFDITSNDDNTVITLAFDDHTPNFEKQDEYEITIVASDDSAPEGVGTVAVTINVVNAEDDGVVTPTQREPQIGKEVVAGLTDEDGNVRGQSWQWFRNATATTETTDLVDTAPLCKDADGNLNDQLCRINDATSPNYTPGDDDEGELLAARVTYTDAFVTPESPGATPIVDAGDSMSVVMQANVEMEDAANTAPKFSDDQDPNTPGKQADAEREVPENKKDANVGDPVTATDTGDLLIYSLSGADEASFTIVSGLKDAGKDAGQIRTAEKLDYETKDMYVVVVTATDPTGATDTINVMISVTDEDDKTVITAVTGPMPEPGDTCGMAEAGSAMVLDCRTLLSIMDELVGDGPALNWSEDTSIADWEGLAARSDRVKGIYLVNEGLAGVLPAGITALDALERLTLTDNDLTGEIPDLTGLDNLTLLVLGGNAFTGGIPASLGNLDSLLRLWLHRNEGGFEGGIPAELGNLSNIRYLMLYGNGLTGEIPSELGNATNLKALYLHNNMLTGSIPAELGNLMTDADDTVRLLYLHNNMLSGDIPAELGNLTSLTALRLSGNMLTGCIPAAIADAAVDADRAGLMACAP